MFEKYETKLLITSASVVYNNLVVNTVDTGSEASSLAVIHEGYVNMINLNSAVDEKDKYIPCVVAGTRPKRVTSVVTQVLWCSLSGKDYFVIASSLGVQLYDVDGRSVRSAHPCKDSEQSSTGHYTRGLATLGQDTLFVGNSVGTLWIFKVRGKRSEDLELVETRTSHHLAITDIASSNATNMIASADESGSVIIWNYGTKLQRLAAFDNYRSSCTSVHLWFEAVICGYGSGHIRCYDTNSGHLTVEIAAHAGNITALDVSENGGCILSVSEDSFARVWKIEPRTYHIKHFATTIVENCFLIGGKFLNSEGTKFCVATYDTNEVQCYGLAE